MTPKDKKLPRILSGMRPTGKLHLGNLVGALQNWVRLQHQYESFHFVADWHMLTTDYADTSAVRENTWEIVADWLAAGLDPKKATFFVQSRLPEHAELHLLFSMITPLGWLERVPTYKEQLENITDRDIHTYGFLGYPLLQSADILMYKAHFVPVGEDQVPHVELTREVARRFNSFWPQLDRALLSVKGLKGIFEYVKKWKPDVIEDEASIKEAIERASARDRQLLYERRIAFDLPITGVFPEPEPLLTPSPRLPGTDGRKMSKSYNNAVFLTDSPDTVSKKLSTMITDPARMRRTDPGNPDVCPVFDLHKIFSQQESIDRVNRECRTAEIGCIDCKKLVAGRVNETLAPIQERRQPYEKNPQLVWDVLDEGTSRARKVVDETMADVRAAVKLI